ncbi:uncharacterized protein Z519_01118 [Cladophialophora bantiana CBS 173.52]|uniref:Heterokaryon incompatibility domain-containing protein n=1 Tax=Cladophialophora bantiana (strain ATCC 10958 / CBS 173.52 / CDC B-1940 / NIH 8579) TaxID=1442370 RepID=A0A0D2IL88_CLAB1|nr:uncharacterized protein Z519_01118 [Cladophialophora bantiana CBS 173.52]KIW97534.1 hypothetical protein Z519_01118 [Cladophialophora bantiana CBS 173.52]
MEHFFDEEDLQATGLNLPRTTWLGFDHDTTQFYDVVDFETYPFLRGWTRAELLDLIVGRLSRSASYTSSMLQSWFTLGFLEATFRQRFGTCDFVSGDQVFCTRFLRQFTKEKIEEVYDMPDAEVVQFLEALDEAQKVAYQWTVKRELMAIDLAALLEAKDLKSGRHQGCTKNSCIAYQLLEETYQTSHIDSSCACSFIAAPPHRLAAILRQGEVPVLNLDALLDDSNEETVTSLKGKANLITFSHVWSDGLGSRAERGIPKCQIKRLRDLVATANAGDAAQPSLAWIYSMCIPREEPLRHAAIQSIASVFPWRGRLSFWTRASKILIPTTGQPRSWLSAYYVRLG